MIISPMWKKKRQNLKKKKNFIRKRLPLHTKQQHKNHPALFVTLLFFTCFFFLFRHSIFLCCFKN
jgi:hypothetical protein